MDIDSITPKIYVGSCPATEEDVRRLRREFGISAVLSVQTDEDLAYLGIDAKRLEAAYLDQGIQWRRRPVRDFDPEALRRGLPDCASALASLLRRGETVLVHCSAGLNRSPSVVIAYLAWCEQVDFDEAVSLVTRRHASQPYLDAIRAAARDRRESGHQP